MVLAPLSGMVSCYEFFVFFISRALFGNDIKQRSLVRAQIQRAPGAPHAIYSIAVRIKKQLCGAYPFVGYLWFSQ